MTESQVLVFRYTRSTQTQPWWSVRIGLFGGLDARLQPSQDIHRNSSCVSVALSMSQMEDIEWEGSEETCDNPEEKRVLFAALDSF